MSLQLLASWGLVAIVAHESAALAFFRRSADVPFPEHEVLNGWSALALVGIVGYRLRPVLFDAMHLGLLVVLATSFV